MTEGRRGWKGGRVRVRDWDLFLEGKSKGWTSYSILKVSLDGGFRSFYGILDGRYHFPGRGGVGDPGT